MVTKLKRYSRHTICKLIAYLLIMVLCSLAFTTLADNYFNIHRSNQQHRIIAWDDQFMAGHIWATWGDDASIFALYGLTWPEEQTIRMIVRREIESPRFTIMPDNMFIEDWISTGYIRAAWESYLGRELTWQEEHALPRILREELVLAEEQTIRRIIVREFESPRFRQMLDGADIEEQWRISSGYLRRALEISLGRNLTWQEEEMLPRIVREELMHLRPIIMPPNEVRWEIFVSIEGPERLTIYDPITLDGRTMIPVRQIAELFGFELYLDAANNEVIVGQGFAIVFDSGTVLPIREAVQIFGLEADWDAENNQITVWRAMPQHVIPGQASPPSLIMSHVSPPELTVHNIDPRAYLELQGSTLSPEWQFIIGLQEVSVYFLLKLPLIILLAFVTGRRPEDDELHRGYLDRIYSDILLAILVAVIVLGAMAWIGTVQLFVDSGVVFESVAPGLWFAGLIGCFTGLLSLIFGNALIRKIKAHNLLQHSLIFKFIVLLLGLFKRLGGWFYRLWLLIFSGFDRAEQPLASRLFKRQRRFLLFAFVLGVLICFFAVLGAYFISFLFIVCILALVYYFLFSNKADFMQLQEGLDASLAERLKSEQMKVDLITNVSHDLKTPLTSIISYADLLAKEKRLSPAAKDYVQILQQKSDRLNHIVSDLFDLAKSTSGNITMEIETLDLKRLFEQTLADLEDRVSESGMEIRSKMPEEPLMIRGDGKKLYRVLQNLLDNALKYSLAGSRVYISLQEHNGKAQAIIKNTACYEMDFDAEEVLQRFNRGDKARSSEGSGLGLAIAQSFIHNCGGDFALEIDGDQFKVIIEFALCDRL